MHHYIVTGPEYAPGVLLIDPRMSLSYLACRSICNSAELVQLNMRTFGASITQAWPAFEHDVLVALSTAVTSYYQMELRGLASALLMRRDVPAKVSASPLHDLLKAKANLADIEVPESLPVASAPELPKVAKPKKAPKQSALQSLLA